MMREEEGEKFKGSLSRWDVMRLWLERVDEKDTRKYQEVSVKTGTEKKKN